MPNIAQEVIAIAKEAANQERSRILKIEEAWDDSFEDDRRFIDELQHLKNLIK